MFQSVKYCTPRCFFPYSPLPRLWSSGLLLPLPPARPPCSLDFSVPPWRPRASACVTLLESESTPGIPLPPPWAHGTPSERGTFYKIEKTKVREESERERKRERAHAMIVACDLTRASQAVAGAKMWLLANLMFCSLYTAELATSRLFSSLVRNAGRDTW